MSYRAIFLLAVSVLLTTGFVRSWLTEPDKTLESWPKFALMLAAVGVAAWLLVPAGRVNFRPSTIVAGVGTAALLVAAVRRPLVLLPYIPAAVAAALAAYILKPPPKK